MTIDSTYDKPFFSIPALIDRLKERGMGIDDNAYAYEVLQRYGYYRLSGYWHIFRQIPSDQYARVDERGREVRLENFLPGTSLRKVVAIYEFDKELRARVADVIATIETGMRFFIGHRLGMIDPFAHLRPTAVALRSPGDSGQESCFTGRHSRWIQNYIKEEQRAKGDFVRHFRENYGKNLPIWVATEIMSFGELIGLYMLMRDVDRNIIAARLQILSRDGSGDSATLANWLNNLRHVRNICAHHGRLWNRVLDVTLAAPGRLQPGGQDPLTLSALKEPRVGNHLYGALIVMRYLLLTIDPNRQEVVKLVRFIEKNAALAGIELSQMGFPPAWKNNFLWSPDYELNSEPARAAALIERMEMFTAKEAQAALSGSMVEPGDKGKSNVKKPRQLLRDARKRNEVIAIQLGSSWFYPKFQFSSGKIRETVAMVNRWLALLNWGLSPCSVAETQLEWWRTSYRALP